MILLDSIRYTLRGSGIIRGFEKTRNQKVSKIANAMQRNFKDVYELTRSSGDDRLTFMKQLSTKYNWDRMEYKIAKPEDKLIIDKLFKTVKNPNQMHYDIVHNFNGTMEELEHLFELTQNKKSRVKFVSRMYNEVFADYPQIHEKLVPEILESRQADEIVKNFDKYKPFLQVNRENSLGALMLNNLIENGNYSREKYVKILKERRIKSHFPNINSIIFTPAVYAERYTEERGALVGSMIKNSFIHRFDLSEEEASELLKIYSSTTQNNCKLRRQIIKAYPEVQEDSPARNPHILQDLNQLFETLDKDKNARSFVQRNMNYQTGVNSVSEYNKMFTLIPPENLETFSSEAMEEIRNTNYRKDYILLLKDKIDRLIEEKNIQKSTGIQGFFNAIGDFSQRILNKIKPMEEKQPIIQAVEKVAEIPVEAEIAPKATTAEDLLKYIPPQFRQTAQALTQPSAPKTPTALKKEQIKENVFSFISKKLGAKTLADQKTTYAKNATKMRLDMLPEIFASISETRKADRMLGKKKSLSSNADAIELFRKINGKNKKLINYLLKKRNDDGTRKFEVKEIISMIESEELTIKENKLVDSGYSPKQIKSHYSYLYDMTVDMFGKIKKQPKLDRKA